MQFAYWFNKNNEYEVVKAEDCNKASDNSYFCLGCGIPVQVYGGGKQPKHFRHKKGTYSKECELYAGVEHKIINSAYEGKKSTLFLISSFNHYKLAIGLPNISESVLNEAENLDLRIKIKISPNSEFDVPVSRKYFSPSTYHYIYLDYLREQYDLLYNSHNIPSEISDKWMNVVSGFRKEGAIFKKSDFACEKVLTKDGVFVGESYLFLSSKIMNFKSIKGINFKEVQEMSFTNLSYWKHRLYEMTITNKTNEVEYFFSSFGLRVKEMQKQPVVLWPPTIEDEDSLLLKQTGEIYLLSDSSELLGSPFDGNSQMSFLQNGLNFRVDKEPYELIKHLSENRERCKSSNGKIEMVLDRKCFVKKFKSNILADFYVENESLSQHSTVGIDKIEFFNGTDLIAVYDAYEYKTKNNSEKKFDMLLLRNLKRIKGKPTVISSKTLWAINSLVEYKSSFQYLKSLVKNGKISAILSKYIEKIAKGENYG